MRCQFVKSNELTRDGWRIVAALYLMALHTFGLAVARYLNSPFRFDEIDQPTQARGILHHWAPKVFYSEERILYTRPFYGYDADYGMTHPPFYLYSLAIPAAFFGNGNRAMRAMSLFWFALSLWLVWRIMDLLTDERDLKMMRGLPIMLAPDRDRFLKTSSFSPEKRIEDFVIYRNLMASD